MLKDRLLKFLKLDGLIETLSEYFETRVELLKVEIKEDVIKLISKILVGLGVAFTVVFFLLLISFAAAYAISTRLGIPTGFVIVAGFYLLVTVLLFLFREPIISKLEKILMEAMQKKDK